MFERLNELLGSIPLLAFVPLGFPIVMVLLYVSRLLPQRPPTPFLEPERWKKLELIDTKKLTHNTRRFRFMLQREDQVLGLPIGQHLDMQALSGTGETLIKPYTPVSDDSRTGFVDFVIKIYPDGKLTPHLDALKEGDKVMVKGPKGRFNYKRNMKRHIGMIAGGTGITPMWQTANQILRDEEDTTELSLIYANQSPDDILIKDLLDHLALTYPQRFKVYYVVDKADDSWRGGTGYISQEMIMAHIPAPADDVLVVRCGPPGMNKAVRQHLSAMGYTSAMQFDF